MVVYYKRKVMSVPCFLGVLNRNQYGLARFQWVEDRFKGSFIPSQYQ